MNSSVSSTVHSPVPAMTVLCLPPVVAGGIHWGVAPQCDTASDRTAGRRERYLMAHYLEKKQQKLTIKDRQVGRTAPAIFTLHFKTALYLYTF